MERYFKKYHKKACWKGGEGGGEEMELLSKMTEVSNLLLKR